jgi:glucokinase
MIVLAGDIGGTNTRLALADAAINRVRLMEIERFRNEGAASLHELIQGFLANKHRPQAACLAVAGPTDGKSVRLTNLAWAIDSQDIVARTGISKVRLINDFAAVGNGLSALDDDGRAALQPVNPHPQGPRLAVGPGTGLGVVQCCWLEDSYRPIASEGGHISFAPGDEQQMGLLRFLRGEHGRVSVERILSGPGITSLYRYCWTADGMPGAPPSLEPAEVTDAALEERDGVAQHALTLFCRIFGQTAGDLALVAQATGGVYLAGGIAPKILPLLQRPAFLEGFRDKGRFSAWMEQVPVHVVLDADVGLKGAALAAAG